MKNTFKKWVREYYYTELGKRVPEDLSYDEDEAYEIFMQEYYLPLCTILEIDDKNGRHFDTVIRTLNQSGVWANMYILRDIAERCKEYSGSTRDRLIMAARDYKRENVRAVAFGGEHLSDYHEFPIWMTSDGEILGNIPTEAHYICDRNNNIPELTMVSMRKPNCLDLLAKKYTKGISERGIIIYENIMDYLLTPDAVYAGGDYGRR